MAHVYLGLGTNLGDKAANLHRAVCGISEKIGKVLSLSSFYETAPWGFTSENSFLNAAVCVETSLSPWEVLHRTQEIERMLGRTLYDKEIIQTPELTLPHPLMLQREFVMKPLLEIASKAIHPVLGKKLGEIDVRACFKHAF